MQKKSDVLVSVALATYNGKEFIEQQLDSVLGQTHSRFEVIIVDDGSEDGTRDVLAAYKNKFPQKIKVFFNETNLGFIENFEKAISLCAGDFIALCDQDDIWVNNKIDRLLEEIEGYALVYSDVSLIDGGGKVIALSRASSSKINNHSDITLEEMIFKSYVIGCASMFRRDLLNDIFPIPKAALFHDWWLALHAIKGGGIKYVPEPLVLYRQHNNNVLGHQAGGVFKSLLKVLFRQRDRYLEFEKKLKRLVLFDKFFPLSDAELSALRWVERYYRSYLFDTCLFRHWILTVYLFRKLSVKKLIV